MFLQKTGPVFKVAEGSLSDPDLRREGRRCGRNKWGFANT